MRKKELVEGILNALDKINQDTNSKDIWVRLESYFAVNNLVCFLKNYATTDDEVNDRVLQRFCDFICDRWIGIRHTAAAYPCNPQTKANLAYAVFARITANSATILLKPNEMLMPSVAAMMVRLSRPNLDDFQWQELVLGDDGTPIEVLACLENAFNKESLELHHTCKTGVLSESERNRVIHQSEATETFYDALEFYLKTGYVYDLFAAQDILQQQIKDPSYVVNADYGIEGKKKLTHYVLSQIKTAEEFIALMENLVHEDEWPSFFESIANEDLNRLFMEDYSLISALQRRHIYSGNIGHDRALIYCYSEIIRRERSDIQPSKGLVGYFNWFNKEYLGQYRRFFNGFTVAEDQAAATLLQVFLRSKRPLYDLKAFLDANNISEEQRAPLYTFGSPLAFLVSQIEKVCDPNYFKPSSSFLARFGL